MAELKTKPHDGDAAALLDSIPDPQRRADATAVLRLMQEATAEPPRLWGTSMVGFGDYHYAYASGREGDTYVVGFAPRKANVTIYLMDGFEAYEDLLGRLGKHTIGKSCLHIKRMSDIDTDVLRELVTRSYAQTSGSR